MNGVTITSRQGLFGPARMPAPVVNRISRAYRAMLSRHDIIDTLGRQGVIAHGSTPAELEAFVKEQLKAWSHARREAGVQFE